MKKLLAALVAVLAILAGCYVASPWWAESRMRKAAEAGDRERLDGYVDYPALRADVAAQLQAGIDADPSKPGFLKALASKVVAAAAEAMTTPENIAALVTTGRASPLDAGARQFPEEGDPERPRAERRRHYQSVGVFDVDLHDPETKDRLATLVFHRDGWFGWKLAGIRFATPTAP